MKNEIEAFTGLHEDALHVYGALLGLMLFAVILRRSVASFWPWLLVLVAECANEIWDIHADGLVEQWEVDGAKHDFLNTMVAASILPLLVRFGSRWLSPDPRLSRTRSEQGDHSSSPTAGQGNGEQSV